MKWSEEWFVASCISLATMTYCILIWLFLQAVENLLQRGPCCYSFRPQFQISILVLLFFPNQLKKSIHKCHRSKNLFPNLKSLAEKTCGLVPSVWILGGAKSLLRNSWTDLMHCGQDCISLQYVGCLLFLSLSAVFRLLWRMLPFQGWKRTCCSLVICL